MKKSNTKNKRWTVGQEDRMLRLVAQGLSQKEIGETLGRSEIAVSTRLHKIRNRDTELAPTVPTVPTKRKSPTVSTKPTKRTAPNKLGSKGKPESLTILILSILLSMSVFVIGLLLLGE